MSDNSTKVAEIDAPLTQTGDLTFGGGENVVPGCECDRLAYSNGILLAASFVSTANQIKAIRAILHSSKRGRVTIEVGGGIEAQYPSRVLSTVDYPRMSIPVLQRDEKGYNLWVHKLDYGKIHATVISKDPALIMHVSPESVWARLMDSEMYETPMIPEWMPYITKRLIEHKYLRECRCFRANAAILDIQKIQQLDEIVIDGLNGGHISIP